MQDTAYGKTAGQSHAWSDSFCQHMVTGTTPQIAPDAMAVPEYATAGVAQVLDIGSYVGIPIQAADGSLFGTICGLDPQVRGIDLQSHALTLVRRCMTARSVGHNATMKTAVVAILGGLLTLAGIALLVLPGPGFVLVAAGLAVLATRFSWANKPLDYAKEKAQEGVEEVGKNPLRAAGAVLAALVLVGLGVLALAGIDLPFVNAFTAVVLIISGLFLVGTVFFARRQEKLNQVRAHRPAGERGTAGAYRAAPQAD